MKPKSITFDHVFERHWHKYLKGITEKQKDRLRERLALFKEDIFDKRLKSHRLKGNLKEYYAFSISYSDRIVFRILEDEAVYFIEIGSHTIPATKPWPLASPHSHAH
jgi:mRNA-degrading endonuclease YafQ of YafQ-DinJ toxin-antitoxin module